MKNSTFFTFLISLVLLLGSFYIVSAEELTTEDLLAYKELAEKGGRGLSGEEEVYEEAILYKEDLRKKEECEAAEICSFGYTLFSSVPTTFALSSDIPVPPSYTLGPGDQLKIEYFGKENLTKEGFITRTGTLHLPLLGPVTLAGLTFSEAEDFISKKIKTELIGTDTFITLGELRSINIYVLGSAYKPGSYTISALSTLTNALFATGGVDLNGSLRNIEVKRNGKTIQYFDLYDLLLRGDTSKDIRLEQGDTIFIPLRKKYASLKGTILRPNTYEFKEGETLLDLLNFGGELNPNSRIELSRVNISTGKRELKLIEATNQEFLREFIQNNDSLSIVEIESLKAKNVSLLGEFNYPGFYGINEGDTILDLIIRAGGLKESAYTPGAVFKRVQIAEQQKRSYLLTADQLEKSLIDSATQGVSVLDGEAYLSLTAFIEKLREFRPEGRQVIEIDLLKLKRDPRLNISLQDGDTLFIPRRSSSISVVGEVLSSASHLYRENLSVNDYIELSGGMTKGADKNKVFVVLPNGQAVAASDKLFSRSFSGTAQNILPGSTIVVSRNPDPFDALKLVGVITPILSDFAIAAASIASINDN